SREEFGNAKGGMKSRSRDFDEDLLDHLMPEESSEIAEGEQTDARSGRFEGRRVESALQDLEDDAHRTGGQIEIADVHRCAARHDLSITELAILQLRAEALGLLPLTSDDKLPAGIASP